MKKLLCLALIGVSIMASAANAKCILPDNAKEVSIGRDFSEDIESEIAYVQYETIEVIVDCGEQGDLLYSQLIQAGATHRDARAERRDFVRDCRGGTWAWLGICVGFIGHCD